jgi:hypothetical protein
MEHDTVELNLPDFWATALFNADTSGFEDEDEKPFQEFCEWMLKHHGNSLPSDMKEEGHFMKYHDASMFGVLACNIHKYTFFITK